MGPRRDSSGGGGISEGLEGDKAPLVLGGVDGGGQQAWEWAGINPVWSAGGLL